MTTKAFFEGLIHGGAYIFLRGGGGEGGGGEVYTWKENCVIT